MSEFRISFSQVKPQPEHTEEELKKLRRYPPGATSNFSFAVPTEKVKHYNQSRHMRGGRRKTKNL